MEKLNINSLLNIYKKELIKRSFTEGSIQTYLDDVRFFLRFLLKNNISDLREITKQTINDYQNYLFYYKTRNKKTLHSSTQSRKLIIVKAFLQSMADLSLILFNPASDIELPRQEKRLPRNILKFKEIEKIESMINNKDLLEFRDKMIIEIFYTTGIRVTELLNIRLNDIDIEDKILHIHKGKGGKSRSIPLLPSTVKLIKKYINQVRSKLINRQQSKYLLCTGSGDKIKYKAKINQIIKKYCKKANIKKNITTHSFRSSFATELLKNGASIRHIQRLLGHERLRTTQIYTQVSIEDLKKIHSQCHPFEKNNQEVNKNGKQYNNNLCEEKIFRTYKRT